MPITIKYHYLKRMFLNSTDRDTCDNEPVQIIDNSDENHMHLFQVITGRMIEFDDEYTYLYWDVLDYAHYYIHMSKVVEYRRKALEAYMKAESFSIDRDDLHLINSTGEIPQSKLNFGERKQFIVEMRPKIIDIIKSLNEDYKNISKVFNLIE